MLDTYEAQKRAGRFEASRPHTAVDRVKRLEGLMLQLADMMVHGRAPARYSPECMPRSSAATYNAAVAAQRAQLEALRARAVAEGSEAGFHPV